MRSALPIDGQGPDPSTGRNPILFDTEPPAAMTEAASACSAPLKTGVRVIRTLFHAHLRGQRVGIFAGSGVGKSTLLAMLARSQGLRRGCVIALVGGDEGARCASSWRTYWAPAGRGRSRW